MSKGAPDDDAHKESRALPFLFYRDPLLALIAEESASCAGCVHERIAFDRRYCDKGRKYGRHCTLYVERRAIGR
jgi:hypothetical protein